MKNELLIGRFPKKVDISGGDFVISKAGGAILYLPEGKVVNFVAAATPATKGTESEPEAARTIQTYLDAGYHPIAVEKVLQTGTTVASGPDYEIVAWI